MPAGESAGTGLGKPMKLSSINEFATDLQTQLSNRKNATATDALLKNIKIHIEALGTRTSCKRGTTHGDHLDRLGTALWNSATRLKRHLQDAPSPRLERLSLYTRVFSFQLLDLAQQGQTSASSVLRILKLALKTARTSLEQPGAEYTTLVLRNATDYIQKLRSLEAGIPSETEPVDTDTFEVEYLSLRILWSWRENKIDLAEHMYMQIEKLRQALSAHPFLAEHLAEVLHDVGSGLLGKSQLPLALKWLSRANAVIDLPGKDELTREAAELRLTILHAIIKANLGTKTAEGLEFAGNTIKQLEGEFGRNKLLVLILQLELIGARQSDAFDSDAYADVLRRMIHSIISDSNFKLWVHHARRLHDKAPSLACAVLDDLLTEFIQADIGRDDWMERVVLTRIWMVISQRESVEMVVSMHESLGRLAKPMSGDATIAAHTLIWRSAETAYARGNFELAQAWCQLALDGIFECAAAITVAKLRRKVLLCCLSSNDITSARTAFYSMASETQDDPLTRYIMYKVALQSNDRALAAECLEIVSTKGSNDLLCACVVDSNKAADRMCAVDALKKLQQKTANVLSGLVHLPAVFRCILRLLCLVLKAATTGDEDRVVLVQDICDVFDGVVVAIDRDRSEGQSKMFDAKELDWFCRNAYNLGIKGCGEWQLHHVTRILTACTNIISRLPQADLPDGAVLEISLRLLFCNFVIAAGLLALARARDDSEQRLQYYLVMRHHIDAFETELHRHLRELDEDCQQDMLLRLSRLLVFDFEGAVALKQWDQLDSIVRRAELSDSIIAYQAMGDCLLRSAAPSEVLFATMRTIINCITTVRDGDHNPLDFPKLAKYIRCLFQVTLPASGERTLQLLAEAAVMVREAQATAGEGRWPADELEWLATVAHNHAADLFRAGKQEWLDWAARVRELAQHCADGGRLLDLLEKAYREFRQSEQEEKGKDVAGAKDGAGSGAALGSPSPGCGR